ncbi:hypothetical protein [Kitasatospora sp. NPDC002965]|uniref:hypothetical protein n=1 Tax=Kitasatospora sp. NPDC002965 TaxID=3154775 RepID=UPI0033AC5BF9
MRKFLRVRTGPVLVRRPVRSPESRHEHRSGSSQQTTVVAIVVLTVVAVGVWQKWTPEQLALVLAALAGCLGPAVYLSRG